MREVNHQLAQIKEDMTVFDVNGEKFGQVVTVHFGDAGVAQSPETNYEPVAQSILDDIFAALRGESVPEEVQERLQMEGFVRINRGAVAADAFVLANQIASVDEAVHLTVTDEAVISTNL